MPFVYIIILSLIAVVIFLTMFVLSLKKMFGKWMKKLIEENSEKTLNMSKEILALERDRMKDTMSEKMG